MSRSPDGQHLGYVADEDINGKLELFVANARSDVSRITNGFSGSEVDQFFWSADSRRGAYSSM